MRKWLLISMLFLQKLSFSQDKCFPSYSLPVLKLAVEEGVDIGYVEAGKGRTLVLLHGLGGNISHWEPVIAILSKHYHVLALDFPGYGTSGNTIQDTSRNILNFYADIVAKFIRKKGIRRVTLIGHSMGGQVSIISSLKHPKLIKKLVLVASAGLETFTQKEADILIAATQPRIFEMQDEAAIRASFKNNFYEIPAKAEVLIQDRLRLKNCSGFKNYTEVVAAGVKGMLNQPVRSMLKDLKQPVLVIFGNNDALIPNPYLHSSLSLKQLVKETVADIGTSSVVLIPNAGHLVQYEKPGELSTAIQQFLK